MDNLLERLRLRKEKAQITNIKKNTTTLNFEDIRKIKGTMNNFIQIYLKI